MKTLAINTASSLSSIALIQDGRAICEQSWPGQNNEAEKLMPAIDELLGGDFAQIDNVLVVRGPGSFTGLRIGVATANAFAYLEQKPLYAIDAFEYWWKAYRHEEKSALLIYAGAGGVYISYGERGVLFDLEDAKKQLHSEGIITIFGDISAEQKEFFSEFDFLEIGEKFGPVMASFDLSELSPQKIVEPLYIKDPGITLSKKNLIN